MPNASLVVAYAAAQQNDTIASTSNASSVCDDITRTTAQDLVFIAENMREMQARMLLMASFVC